MEFLIIQFYPSFLLLHLLDVNVYAFMARKRIEPFPIGLVLTPYFTVKSAYVRKLVFLFKSCVGCFRYILKIWWPKKITNRELWRITGESDIDLEMRRRKFGWLDHTLRKGYGEITSTALTGSHEEGKA